MKVFTDNFTEYEFAEFDDFRRIFDQFPNPEDINDNPETAPSKRLIRHIKGYNKIVYGATIAADIGLTKIREKCPRFNNWINRIEQA